MSKLKNEFDLWAIILIAGGILFSIVSLLISGIHYRMWEASGGVIYQTPKLIIALQLASACSVCAGILIKIMEVCKRQ